MEMRAFGPGPVFIILDVEIVDVLFYSIVPLFFEIYKAEGLYIVATGSVIIHKELSRNANYKRKY